MPRRERRRQWNPKTTCAEKDIRPSHCATRKRREFPRAARSLAGRPATCLAAPPPLRLAFGRGLATRAVAQMDLALQRSSAEMLQNRKRRFLRPFAFLAGRANARWAATLARARSNQFLRAPQQQVVNSVERLAEADAARIGIVEIQIRFEEFFHFCGIVRRNRELLPIG